MRASCGKVVVLQGKSFSKMPSSLITKSYVLIVGPYVLIYDDRMGNVSLIHEFKTFMINSCKKKKK